jgi:class 3 adenylate cyclase/type II secretory pathway predicted ATPase ExeA
MPRCRSCNEPNAEGARFCSSCGVRLDVAAVTVGARKTVTVVFADIVESTSLVERLEPETAQRVLDRFFDCMREVVERHGGRVEKFIGDAVMAVFGVPVLHEDDADRAVRAAAGMRDALDRLNAEFEETLGAAIQMRIGVATGEVVTGDPSSGKPIVTGDAVNVAARLQTVAAPGTILIADSTHALVREIVSAEPVGPMQLKGKTGTVTAHRVLKVGSEPPRRRLESEFVGRRRELGVLSGLLMQVSRDRVSRLVTVVGDAGVGKSRLVREFLGTRIDDAAVAEGRCLPYGDGITYWPLKEAVAQAAELRGDETADEARARIRGLLREAPDADLVTERVAETIGIADAVPEHKGATWAVGRLIEEVARTRPLVVVLDDIQWAESTFLDLVEHTVQNLEDTPLLVLCMARPELLDTRLSWSGADDRSTLVHLQPLSDDDSGRLIEALLDGGILEAAARERIVEASDGLPLFVEEMVAMLIENGTLRRENGRWAAADLSRIAAPATIHALLASRLDQLDPAQRAVLQRGSVEGQLFHRSAVEFLSPRPESHDVEERLSELVVKELIEPEGAEFSTDDAFRFHHLLLRDVAYESVQKDERASLHERFADWLDDQAGERASEYDEIAGYHLEQAVRYQIELRAGSLDGELGERGGMRLGGAGLRAHARGDWPAAVSLLTRAQALLPARASAQSVLELKLLDARIEMSPVAPSRLRSANCFWHWPIGHRWTLKQREGVLSFRCASCGRERNRRGADAVLDAWGTETRATEIEMSQDSGGWRGGGWGI